MGCATGIVVKLPVGNLLGECKTLIKYRIVQMPSRRLWHCGGDAPGCSRSNYIQRDKSHYVSLLHNTRFNTRHSVAR
jgi:hypothetical protein